MKELIEKIQRRKEIKGWLKFYNSQLHGLQIEIDDINHELDLIKNGEKEASEAQVGELLHKKISIQGVICNFVEKIVRLENELKGLF